MSKVIYAFLIFVFSLWGCSSDTDDKGSGGKTDTTNDSERSGGEELTVDIDDVLSFGPLDYENIRAATIHIAQTARGADTGNDAANVHSIGWFNDISNWGTGTGQIAPGAVVAFHDEITTALTIQGDGATGEGQSIQIDFSDATLNTPQPVKIHFNGHKHITVSRVTFDSSINSGVLFQLGQSADFARIQDCSYTGSFDSEADAIYHQYAANSLIEGNTFINVRQGIYGDSLLNHNITIRNNTILGCTGAVDMAQDIVRFGDACNVLIEGNHFAVRKDVYPNNMDDDHSDVLQTYRKGGGNASYVENWVIRYNLFELDTPNPNHRSWMMVGDPNGIFVIYSNVFLGTSGGSQANGIRMGAMASDGAVEICNNTFVVKGGPNNLIYLDANDTYRLLMKNNIFHASIPISIISRIPARTTRSNNIYYGAQNFSFVGGDADAWLSGIEGSINGQDPMFMDFDSNDFRIQATSPAKDNGISLGKAYDTGLNNSSPVSFPNPSRILRSADNRWNTGAYE
ncbi:MAG: right-handed parallel beta-helix repeat-containing protein [Deltaproteobacteria bacterium]|nr:right-handed parallel beta-helix repeat-containing protein [Deltaproteobacteria bacterium]